MAHVNTKGTLGRTRNINSDPIKQMKEEARADSIGAKTARRAGVKEAKSGYETNALKMNTEKDRAYRDMRRRLG
jgi:hypothetical protein